VPKLEVSVALLLLSVYSYPLREKNEFTHAWL